MKTHKHKPPGLFSKLGAIAFSALAIIWLPQAEASVSGGARIENIATVTWQDSTAVVNPAYTASDYTWVTVTTLDNPVTISGRPTGVNAGDTAAVPTGQTVLNGANATYLYAITATANGIDTYALADTVLSAPVGVSGQTITLNLMQADGTTVASGGVANLTLGAAIVENVVNNTTLEFPGGSLAASGISDAGAGDIVVINGVDYLVTSIVAGNAPDASVPTGETLDTMVLAANPAGSATVPNFTVTVAAGDVVGEQQLLQVVVTASLSVATVQGTVDHTVVVNKGSGVNEASEAAVTTTFDPLPTVSITKAVRNITAAGGFGATANGDPGDILEYRLTISNSGSTAEAVVVTDPVPTYTTLQTFLSGTGYPDPAVASATLGDGNGAATNVFALVSDSAGPPAVTAGLTMQNTDDEGATVGSGNATGTAAGSTLTIYLGRDQIPSNTGPTVGGDIADSTTTPADVFFVYYRVRINP